MVQQIGPGVLVGRLLRRAFGRVHVFAERFLAGHRPLLRPDLIAVGLERFQPPDFRQEFHELRRAGELVTVEEGLESELLG